jgi:hypothetical protein
MISLVYLAFQVRQNTDSLRSENYGRAMDRVSSLQSRLSADPDLAEVFNRGVVDASRLEPTERIQLTWARRRRGAALDCAPARARSLRSDF